MKSKTYYFIISIFAIIGVSLLFENPILLGIASFGIGIGYKEYTPKEKDDDESPDLLDDYN